MGQPLYLKYRPKSWEEVIGQDAVVKRLSRMDFRGRAFWISGRSGLGKTSIAYIIARQVADDWYIEELDGDDLTPAWLREFEAKWSYYCSGPGGRACIVNEAHGLSKRPSNFLSVNSFPGRLS